MKRRRTGTALLVLFAICSVVFFSTGCSSLSALVRSNISGYPYWYYSPLSGIPAGKTADFTWDKIGENLARPLSIEGLAAESGMSVAHFQRMFMKIIGVRPGRYIVQQRLNSASRLLETTDLCVSDIAISTGFCDQSHFTKMFKRERGMTPGEYRRRHHHE